MADSPLVVLPPLLGGQAESWAALVELAPALEVNWLLVGGQMVFLHEVERGANEVRPTDDVDVVVDLRAEPEGLGRMHLALDSAGFVQDSPSPEGILGVADRQDAGLTKGERRTLTSFSNAPELSKLAVASLRLMVNAGTAKPGD